MDEGPRMLSAGPIREVEVKVKLKTHMTEGDTEIFSEFRVPLCILIQTKQVYLLLGLEGARWLGCLGCLGRLARLGGWVGYAPPAHRRQSKPRESWTDR